MGASVPRGLRIITITVAVTLIGAPNPPLRATQIHSPLPYLGVALSALAIRSLTVLVSQSITLEAVDLIPATTLNLALVPLVTRQAALFRIF